MNQSQQIDQLLNALYEAKAGFKELEKNGKNFYFKNAKGQPHLFSTLDDIFNACKDALRANKIEVIYGTRFVDGYNHIVTKLFHIESAQWMESVTAIGDASSNPQAMGSAITYMRRYHIQAMLNLEADFEDDGNQASGRNTNTISEPRKEKPVDYDYSGPPYRIFGADKSLIQEFSEIKPWGVMIKSRVKKMPELKDSNRQEIARIRKDVSDTEDITDRAKAALLHSIDTILSGEK